MGKCRQFNVIFDGKMSQNKVYKYIQFELGKCLMGKCRMGNCRWEKVCWENVPMQGFSYRKIGAANLEVRGGEFHEKLLELL